MSMTGVHRALYAFWSQFAPAYLSGHVPDDASYPYITFSVESTQPIGYTFLVAQDWHKAESGVNINAERAEMMDKIAEAIPPDGVKLTAGDGCIVLSRTDGFQSYYDDPQDPAVIGGRTQYRVQYYTM